MNLSPEHEQMTKRLEDFFQEKMRHHEQSFHDLESDRIWYEGGLPVSAARLVKDSVKVKDNLDQIADAFLGTPKPEFMGGGRMNNGVIQRVHDNSAKLEEVYRSVKDPEVKLKLPVALWIAIVTTIGLLGVAVIEALASG